ncbi:MAG: two-component regulator propeller domain-containing protein [Flavobacteriales bacterium]
MKRWSILVGIIFVANGAARAQFPRFRVLNSDNGLAQNTVKNICQDQRGFIWIGTYDGVQRYDGYNYISFRFNPKDTNGLQGNVIDNMLIDYKGKVWLSIRGEGISTIDPQTFKIENFRKGKGKYKISGVNPSQMAETPDHKIVAVYGEGKIDVLNPATGTAEYLSVGNSGDSIPAGPFSAICIDKNGKWWMAVWGKGLVCYNPVKKTHTYFTPENTPGFYGGSMRSVFCDSKNRIWISCWFAGTCMYDQKSGKMHSNKDPQSPLSLLEHGLVWDIAEDNRGNIWLASAEKGLMRLNTEKKELRYFMGHPELKGTLGDNNVMSVMCDRNGLIWAGTWTGGLGIYNPVKDFVYGYSHVSDNPLSVKGNIVWSLCKNENGEIHIGTGNGGIQRFDPKTGTFHQLEFAQGSAPDMNDLVIIQCLADDGQGNLWIGTSGTGLFRYDKKTKLLMQYKTSTNGSGPSGEVQVNLKCEKNGDVWICMNGDGLNRYIADEKRFEYYHPGKTEGELNARTVVTMCKDKDFYWVATDAGLFTFNLNTRKFKRIPFMRGKKGSMSSEQIYSMFLGKDGSLWIGTSAGLNKRLSDGTFEVFTMEDGLPNNIINSVQEDNNGRLWISTNNGMALFDKRTERIKSFNTTDGFQSEFNQSSGLIMNDGRLLFGGINGLTIIAPTRLTADNQKPEVNFTGIQVLNRPYKALKKSITYLNEITLSYRDYVFSFDFAATDYSNPERIKYKYLLEGFDEDWVDLGNKHSVSFTNISPGTYTLHVLATNSEGVWGEKPAQLTITITPPFWRTTWFYILCGIIILLSAYGYLRLRERNLRKEKQILEEKVEKRTVELRHEKEKVEEAHREIKDSINYAKRIQESILPDDSEIKKVLADFFILFHPKDVVSGDFFWHYRIPDTQQVLIAAADCTGHGVPGAFMSMIGNTLLNEIVIQNNQYKPHEVLNQLHIGVRKALQQDRLYSDSRDGMDICLCFLDLAQKKVLFAGANRPLLILRKNEFIEFVPDKMPIGGLQTESKRQFLLKEEKLEAGDKIYLFSDGIIDQFGGDKGKKFKLSRLREKLKEYSMLTMTEQKQRINDELQVWKGRYEQTDDICLIGISVK